MARYLSPEGLEYNPPSLDMMLKPLEIYRDAYNKLEKEVETQQLDAKNYSTLLDPRHDVRSASLFKQYNDALDASAQSILNNASFSEVKRNALNARRLYKDVLPVISAYAARQADRNKAAQLNSRGYITDFDPYDSSVDDYLYGNTPQMNSVKLDDLFKLGLRDTETYSAKQINSFAIPGNKTRTITGVPTEMFDGWVTGQIEDNNLTNIYNSIVAQYPMFAQNPQFQQAVLNGMRAGCKGKVYDTQNAKPKSSTGTVSKNESISTDSAYENGDD